jgi:hypothetical protein
MRERRIGYGRLGTITPVERVDASQMRERRIGFRRLGTITPVERVDASQMRERRIGFRRLGTVTHVKRVDTSQIHKILGVQEDGILLCFAEIAFGNILRHIFSFP